MGGGAVNHRMIDIVAETCNAACVTPGEIRGPRRSPRIVAAREVCVVLARRHTAASYPEIARAIGRTTHSTVFEAHQRNLLKPRTAPPWPGSGWTWETLEKVIEGAIGVNTAKTEVAYR